MNEFELINRYFRDERPRAGVALGIGDDAAVLALPAASQLVVSVDTLVAGRHFPENAEPAAIAQRALAVSLSDLAAMGADARWFTLSLTLPEADEPWLEQFSAGLKAAAEAYGCALVGGDTTRGALTIGVQVMGCVPHGQAISRCGAKPGDRIFVTGSLGDGAGALKVLAEEHALDTAERDYLRQRYYQPMARLEDGVKLRGVASAAIDISDGLLADLEHICERSSVGARIEVEKLPVSPALRKLASVKQCFQWALAGGDDYQLCFTVPAACIAALEALRADGLKAEPIGEIRADSGIECWLNGEPFVSESTGYQHFD